MNQRQPRRKVALFRRMPPIPAAPAGHPEPATTEADARARLADPGAGGLLVPPLVAAQP